MPHEPSDEARDGCELSIVMPCLNEAQTVGRCVAKARQFLRDHRIEGEVIVADNGSQDRSPEIAQSAGARVVHEPVNGYGAALLTGIQAARGRWVIIGDADDSYDFSALAPLIEKLREGYDFVIGCRFPSGGGRIMPGAMPWLHRLLGNPVLSRIGRLFFRCPVTDLYCGLRAFTRQRCLELGLRMNGMEFAYEMVIKATLGGLRIAEVPITLYKDGRDRPSHLRTWQDGWRTLRFMLLYSPSWLFLVPGMALLAIGTLFGGILLVSPVELFGIGFDTNTLLVCAMMVLIGFNLVSFAMFAKFFALSEGLLPVSPRLQRWFAIVTLETGILIGLLFLAGGLGLLIASVLYWSAHQFGPLSYPDSLRLVIPGVTGCTLGIEIIFSSFFMSILALRRK